MSRLRLAGALAAAALLLMVLPATAAGKSYDINRAEVSLQLAPDASLLVTERLRFDFDGDFEGAYRDIPLEGDEKITDIQVSEGGRLFRPGGNTDLGSTDLPGVFGAVGLPGGARIVWHYRAADENRTFTLSYRVLNIVKAYDDVLDVNWKVWGSQWDFQLPELSASLRDPRLNPSDNAYQVAARPLTVEAESFRGKGVARLEATDVPHNTFVELRITVPRQPEDDVSGAVVENGPGLQKILDEEQDEEDTYNSTYNRFKRWVADNAVLASLLLAALSIMALILMRVLAREHPTSVPEHLPEPPDDASPALAYGLAHEGGDSTNTVLATLLDLVERGY